MKKHIVICLIFFSFFLEFSMVFGQYNIMPKRPYEPIKFEGLEPVWHETLFDPAFIGGDTCDGYNLFERAYFTDVVFEDDFMYKINHKFGTAQYNGTYIEKRNIITGGLVWRSYYGLPVDGYQDFGRMLFINEEDQLEVLSQLKISPYADINDFLLSFDNCLLTKRIYDKNSGSLVFSELPDVTDTTLLRTNFSMWINSNEFFRSGKDSFYYYRYHNTVPNSFIFEHQLTKIGYSNNKDSLRYYFLPVINFGSPEYLIQLDSNTILFVERDRDKGKAILRYTNNFLDLKEEFYSDSISYYLNGLSFQSYDPVNKTILLRNSYQPTSTQPTAYEVIVMDLKGKILNRARLHNHYSSKFDFLSGNDHSRIRIMASGFDHTEKGRIFTYLDILSLDENGIVKLEKRFPVKDSLRFVADFQVFFPDDEHYLIHWWERSNYYDLYFPKFDVQSSAMAWIKFKKSDLGTANTNDFFSKDFFNVFPNPVHDRMQIQFENNIAGKISVHDIQGRFIFSSNISNQTLMEIDVSHLKSGPYVIFFETTNSLNNKKFRGKTFYKN